MSIGKLTSVSVAGDALLLLGWDDGRIAPVDLRSTIAKRPALASLSDPRTFAASSIAIPAAASAEAGSPTAALLLCFLMDVRIGGSLPEACKKVGAGSSPA